MREIALGSDRRPRQQLCAPERLRDAVGADINILVSEQLQRIDERNLLPSFRCRQAIRSPITGHTLKAAVSMPSARNTTAWQVGGVPQVCGHLAL